jgi:hypothetical protein
MPVGCGLWSDFVEEFKIFDFFEHKLLNPIQNVKSISIKVAVGALLAAPLPHNLNVIRLQFMKTDFTNSVWSRSVGWGFVAICQLLNQLEYVHARESISNGFAWCSGGALDKPNRSHGLYRYFAAAWWRDGFG